MNKYETWISKEWSPVTEQIVARACRNLLLLLVLMVLVAVALGGAPWSPMRG